MDGVIGGEFLCFICWLVENVFCNIVNVWGSMSVDVNDICIDYDFWVLEMFIGMDVIGDGGEVNVYEG